MFNVRRKSFDDRSIYMLAIDRKENRRNKEGKKERKKEEEESEGLKKPLQF